MTFVDSVLQLHPRVAAFDCDGTLWSGDAGESFFAWEIEQGVVSPARGRETQIRYAEYKAGRVSEDQMCGEMVTMHAGMLESKVTRAATEFWEHSFPGKIFPEMLELMRRLQAAGCDVWAVSSSNEWVIQAAMKQFGIAEPRILATAVEVDHGVITDRLIRIPSGPGKPKALREVISGEMDAAFGNSKWDTEMLEMARHAFAVNPSKELEATAKSRHWTIYFPQALV